MKSRTAVWGCAAVLCVLAAGFVAACPPLAATAVQAYSTNSCYATAQATYATPVLAQLVVPYTPTVQVPAAVTVQQQVQTAPMPQATIPAPAPAVVERQVQVQAYSPALAAVPVYAQRAVVTHSYGQAAFAQSVVVQRNVVHQRAVVPARVVVANAGRQRVGPLRRIVQRVQANRAGRGVPASTTVIVR